jgi:hypothetical protein
MVAERILATMLKVMGAINLCCRINTRYENVV